MSVWLASLASGMGRTWHKEHLTSSFIYPLSLLDPLYPQHPLIGGPLK